MIRWLTKRFVKNSDNTQDQSVRAAYGTMGSVVGMCLNVFLSVMKLLLGFLIGSVAVMADGVNNLSDAGGSVVALVSVKMAQKPYDEEHPFGHGRIEYIGALAVGVLIVIFGIELLKSGIDSILAPQNISFSILTLVLMVVSVLTKLWMWKFYRYIGMKTDNMAMLAAGKDSLSDTIATGAVILSMVISMIFGWPVDGYVGILVSLLVLWQGWSVLRDTASKLLGGKPNKELGTQILDQLLSYPEVLGVHDFVLHDYGPGRSMASVHAEVSADSNIVAIHEVIDQAEREISMKFNIPICIHMDPIVKGDSATENIRDELSKYLASLTPPLKLHDFRRVPGENSINLVFDVLLPAEEGEIHALHDGICAYARTIDPRFHCVIHFDRDYFSNVTSENDTCHIH